MIKYILYIGGKRPGQITPPNRTAGAAALHLRVRLHPARSPRRALSREIPSPSLRAHIRTFGSAAATKCATPRRIALFRLQDLKNARGGMPSKRAILVGCRAFRSGGAPKSSYIRSQARRQDLSN